MTLQWVSDAFLDWAGGSALWLAAAALLLGVAAGLFFLLSLPLRRAQSTRLFLDLLETGLNRGGSVEQAIVGACATGDRELGPGLHWLAQCLAQGKNLLEALRAVGSLAPPQIISILEAGYACGDLRRVLPVARRALGDGISQCRAALNYHLAVAFAVNPCILVAIPLVLNVIPTHQEIAAATGGRLPYSAPLLTGLGMTAWAAHLAAIMLLYGAVLFMLGGPRFTRWLESGWPPLSDWIYLRLPWRRRLLQRDFSHLLSLLLDAQVPEDLALTLASAGTGNGYFVRRMEPALAMLRGGGKLEGALAQLDETGEFTWRLANAARGRTGFYRALLGWHEALEARAFQQEQAVAQLLTTAMVLVNGLGIATIAYLIMRGLAVIEALWWLPGGTR